MKKNMFRVICFSATAVSLIISGCRSAAAVPEKQPPSAKTEKFDLSAVIEKAVKKNADIRVLESLQTIAREHVEKSRLLELPGLIYDLPRRLPELTVDNDFRLNILDHALESCRILTRPAQTDLNKIQKDVEIKKISFEQSVRLAKLDYIRRLKQHGINSAGINTMQKDIILELSISSEIPEKMIENFDYTSLPQPFLLKFPPPPDCAADILKFYGSAPDAALRFADIIYRLPTELLHRKNSDFNAAFELALSAGTAIKFALVKAYADSAFQKYQKALEKKQEKISDPRLVYSEIEQARLEWRIAYFRKQYDTASAPAKPNKKEQAFLKDLLSLQQK